MEEKVKKGVVLFLAGEESGQIFFPKVENLWGVVTLLCPEDLAACWTLPMAITYFLCSPGHKYVVFRHQPGGPEPSACAQGLLRKATKFL